MSSGPLSGSKGNLTQIHFYSVGAALHGQVENEDQQGILSTQGKQGPEEEDLKIF